MRPDNIYDMSDSVLIESDDVSLITKLTVRPEITALKFNEKSFFNTILGFSSHWDYKNFASCDHEYYSARNRNLSTIEKNHLKCDCIDGWVLNRKRRPILYSFVLYKSPSYKVFSEPETILYKKINKGVLHTITFHLEDDNNEEVNFNREPLTFTLQMIRN